MTKQISFIVVEKAERYGETVYRPACRVSRLFVRMRSATAKEITADMRKAVRSDDICIYDTHSVEVTD